MSLMHKEQKGMVKNNVGSPILVIDTLSSAQIASSLTTVH